MMRRQVNAVLDAANPCVDVDLRGGQVLHGRNDTGKDDALGRFATGSVVR